MGLSSRLNSTAISAICAALSSPAFGQEAQPRSVLGDEIIVTAQKREQNVQDVGVSVTALQGEDLKALGMTNASDVAALIPAVNIQSVGGTDAQLIVNIRGVSQNDFGDHNEPPIAIYVDEAYVSWLGAVGMMTYDMDRVEALRGPQGTLFGRNATGGLVHFITNRPSSEFVAEAAGEYSSHDSYRFDGVVGGALAEGVSGRLAAAYDRTGDYIENRAGPDLGEARRYAVRAQLLFEPSDAAEILLKGEYSSLEGDGSIWTHRAAAADPANQGVARFIGDSEIFWDPTLLGSPGCAGCDALGYKDADGDIDAVDLNDPSFIDRDIFDVMGRVVLGVGGVTLTSISDYRYVDREFADDSDGGPVKLSAFSQNIDGGSQFSQELRLDGETERFNWILGGYYLTIEGDYLSRLDTTFTGDPALDFVENTWRLETESYAVFGHGDFALSPALSIVGGVRWTHEEKDFSYANTDGFGGGVLGGGLVFTPATVGSLAHQEGSNISFKAGLDWRASDNTLVYVSISRANKGGGFSSALDGFLLPSEVPYVDEVLTSYEGGVKTSALDGRLRLNAGVFYYDYDDYQAFTFEGLTQKIINLEARVFGSEVEITANPADGLDLMLGASWLRTRAYDVPMPDGSVADRRLPQAPNFSIKGLIRKAWATSIGEFALQADGNFQTRHNYNIVGHETTAVDDVAIVNGCASFSPTDDKFTFSFFVDNLFDERFAVSAIDTSGAIVGGASLRAMNRPRWFGGDIRVRF